MTVVYKIQPWMDLEDVQKEIPLAWSIDPSARYIDEEGVLYVSLGVGKWDVREIE